ncbi:MAG: DUF6457 domain-containing protein [Acidimicrobiia bacterium]
MADPELLDWLRRALAAAGVDPATAGDLCSDEAVTVILDLARDAAHGVARPAAPLAAFAVGLATGRSGADGAGLRDRADAVAAAAGAA